MAPLITDDGDLEAEIYAVEELQAAFFNKISQISPTSHRYRKNHYLQCTHYQLSPCTTTATENTDLLTITLLPAINSTQQSLVDPPTVQQVLTTDQPTTLIVISQLHIYREKYNTLGRWLVHGTVSLEAQPPGPTHQPHHM